jgi:hypothetical protein
MMHRRFLAAANIRIRCRGELACERSPLEEMKIASEIPKKKAEKT